MTAADQLAAIEARIHNCKTERTMSPNVTAALEDRTYLLAMVRELQGRVDKVAAYCEQAARMISTDPEVGDYERGFDDSTRGMSARIRAAITATEGA